MAAGDIAIKGWAGSAGDYYKELAPEFSTDFKLAADGVSATRTIRRRLICLAKHIDLALAQAKTSGTSLTLPVVDTTGAATTLTLSGAWSASAIDATEYATGYSLIVMACRVTVIPALTYNLESLVTITQDESDADVMHIQYNGTTIESFDAGAGDGSGMTIVADLSKRMDYEPVEKLIASLRLYVHGTMMEQWSLPFKDLPLDWYRGAQIVNLYGPVNYPEGELDTDAIAALATQAGCEVADIKSRIDTVQVRISSDESPVWISGGTVSTTTEESATVQNFATNPSRQYSTELRKTITYYRSVPVYVRDQDKALRDFRTLGLRWVKTGSTLKLVYGSYIWKQWDVTALEPAP